jgi:hypothetical protein
MKFKQILFRSTYLGSRDIEFGGFTESQSKVSRLCPPWDSPTLGIILDILLVVSLRAAGRERCVFSHLYTAISFARFSFAPCGPSNL